MLTWTSLFVTLACIRQRRSASSLGRRAPHGRSVFDAFDGIVARQKNLSSDSGEVLDAVVDRYCDAAPAHRPHDVLSRLAPRDGGANVRDRRLDDGLVRSRQIRSDGHLAPADAHAPSRAHRLLAIALVAGPAISAYFGKPYGIENVATLAIVGFVAVLANYAGLS